MKAIGYTTITVALMIYSTLLGGWAVTKLWSWFIVPTFGLTALSIPAAIGLSLVVGYLTHQTDLDKKSESEEWIMVLVKGAVHSTLKPLFALGFGAIVAMWV